MRRDTAHPTEFVRTEELPKLAEQEKGEKAFRRWQAYSEQLRRDPSLLAYYDFQPKEGSPDVLQNVAQGGRSCDGVIESATWTAGRSPGKRALLFQKPSDHVRIDLPQKADHLTLAAWVCFNAYCDNGQLSSGLVMSEKWGVPGNVHWQVETSGRMGFSTYPTAGDGNEGGDSTWTLANEFPIGRWIHLAVAYDRTEGLVRAYIDGRPLGSAELRRSGPIVVGPAWIGNWIGDSAHRGFRGRMDELAVFGRALDGQEVRQIHSQGKP